jgi:hypothetical protein
MATTNQDFAKTHLVSLTNFGFSQKNIGIPWEKNPSQVPNR